MMTAPADLPGRLADATPAELAAFAAACATRLTPVFEYFALAGRGRYRDWVTQLWACACSPDIPRARELRRQIDSAPEADRVADPNKPDYYAQRVLGAPFYAAGVLLDDDKAARALACAQEAQGLLAEFDYLLEIPPGSSRSLKGMELRAQHEYLDHQAQGHEATAAGGAAEARSSLVHRQLQEAAPAIARVCGWDLADWRRD